MQSHRGHHYRVDHGRVYDLPAAVPEIVVSGFGQKSVELAARVGDGYCTVGPDADSVQLFRSQAARGRLVQGGVKVCWSHDTEEAVNTVHGLWPNDALPGELAQVLPTPEHFEQASELVTKEMLAGQIPCGPDVETHVAAVTAYADAGFDELYVNQIGPGQDAFFDAYREHVLPRFQ